MAQFLVFLGAAIPWMEDALVIPLEVIATLPLFRVIICRKYAL